MGHVTALSKFPKSFFAVENSYSLKLSPRDNLNAFLIAEELRRRNYEVEWVRLGMIRFMVNGTYLAFRESQAPHTSKIAVDVCWDKPMTALLLRGAGLEVAEGREFSARKYAAAIRYASRLGQPVVIKPAKGGKGIGVTVGISLKNAFAEAFALAASLSRTVLIERQFRDCVEARFLVTGGRCVAVVGRRPPIVIGNGFDTVTQLIEAKNRMRARNPNLAKRLITMDAHRIGFIGQQGYQLSDIPKEGDEIVIDLKAGLSTGADSFDLTDYVHSSFLDVSARATAAVFNADPAGVDILARDFAKPAEAGNYMICEINTRPGLGGHHFPVYGTSRNVASPIVDHALRVAARTGLQEDEGERPRA